MLAVDVALEAWRAQRVVNEPCVVAARMLAHQMIPRRRQATDQRVIQPAEAVQLLRRHLRDAARHHLAHRRMPAVQQHHARPILAFVVEVIGLERRAEVLPAGSGAVVVPHALHRVSVVAQRPEVGYVTPKQDVRVDEQRPAPEVLQARDQVAASDECVRAARMVREPVERRQRQRLDRHRDARPLDDALRADVKRCRLSLIESDPHIRDH